MSTWISYDDAAVQLRDAEEPNKWESTACLLVYELMPEEEREMEAFEDSDEGDEGGSDDESDEED